MSTATFSECGMFRYTLTRLIRPDDGNIRRRLLFVMCNPSRATAETNDNTITRCIGFATELKVFSSLEVVNPYAFRTKSPDVLMAALGAGKDVIGPDNDAHILWAAARAYLVLVAWGSALRVKHPAVRARVDHVIGLLHRHHKKLYCLDTTKAGEPRHPLMLEYGLTPRVWREAA